MNLYFMSELTTVTVSRKGQALLPLKWRKTFGLESGGPCDARELNDGKGSLFVHSASLKARHGAKGLLAHLREQTVSFPRVPPPPASIQMSYLLDTDIISSFNNKTIPPKMAAWLVKNESDSFISLVSVAEMRHGLDAAPESHREELMRRIEAAENIYGKFYPAGFGCLDPVETIAVGIKKREPAADLRRFIAGGNLSRQ